MILHRMASWRARAVTSLFVLAICAGSAAAQAQRPAASEYIVGPNDVLAVTVFNQDKLTNKYTVGSDGTFAFPYLGRVVAGGQSVQAVERDIRTRLEEEKLLVKPQVIVAVDQYRSQQVYLIGQVRQAQPLEFRGSMTLVEALARAGALTDRAGTEAIVTRSSDGKADPAAAARAEKQPGAGGVEVIRIDLEKLNAGDLSQNLSLRAGDVISVPVAKTVFVKGQVARPGEYPLRRGMTVQKVLALAGGVTELGDERRIDIIRTVDGKSTKLKATVESAVLPDDLIEVRKRVF